MRECERCGTVVPVIEMHTAADGCDVCPECCDICNDDEPSEETAMTPTYLLTAGIHMDARGVTVRSRLESTSTVFLNVDIGLLASCCISGTLAEVRAVAEAITAAVDEIEGGE